MEKLPLTRTSMFLLFFFSPCIVHGQYYLRQRGEVPVRVSRGGPAPIPYHDYVQPHPLHQNQNVILHPNLNGFSNRKGPFDAIIDRAKSWLPGSNGEVNSEPKMRDAHRVPNPPKYPLYDLPTIGMATPPPAPLMHPMAQIPTGNYNYEEELGRGGSYSNANDLAVAPSNIANNRGPAFNHGHSPNRKKPLRGPRPKIPPRGPHPFRPNNKKRLHNHAGPGGVPPNRRQHQHHQRQRPRGPPPVQNRPNRLRAPPQKEEGFEHPMASNINPVNSPALGRPLDYDEYMKRPSHSFTDDPWNFDPFAAQMNQGMNTYALKYNYDPLGMNNLDNKANSHLDPAKLSYPGDYYNREVSDSSTNSQIGGWDRPPGGYNGYMSNNQNSNPSSQQQQQQPPNNYDTSLTNPLDGGRIGPLDPFSSGSENLNSFNLFQQSQQQNNPPVGPTATVDLESLQPPSEDKIEFTIETSMDPNGPNQNQNSNDNSKLDNFSGLSDNYSPYGADTPEGAPIGPPYGSLADSNADLLQPPASFSYSRTSDYGMRNRRANMMCQYGNANCLRRQFQRNLVIPTNSPNMLYNPNVQKQQVFHGQQEQQQMVMPTVARQSNYYPMSRHEFQFRRQMNSARQMNYNLGRGEMAMETHHSPQHAQTRQMHGHAVPRTDSTVPEGLQIFSELMKQNGNPNLLSQSAKADARNNLLKVLTQ